MVSDMNSTVTDTGRGRPYLLLHGGGGPTSMAGFGTLLAEHGRVVAPTHPGFSGTPRPEAMDSARALAARYVELLAELDLSGVCVLGNSLGGWVAAEMALLGSPRLAAAVLIDAVGIEVPAHPIPDVASLTPHELARRAWYDPAKMPDPTTLPPAVQAVLPSNMAALAAYGGSMQDPTLLGRLKGVRTPALVVWGRRTGSGTSTTAGPMRPPSQGPASSCCRTPATCRRSRHPKRCLPSSPTLPIGTPPGRRPEPVPLGRTGPAMPPASPHPHGQVERPCADPCRRKGEDHVADPVHRRQPARPRAHLGADEQGPVAGPRISEDYPEALEEVIALARARA